MGKFSICRASSESGSAEVRPEEEAKQECMVYLADLLSLAGTYAPWQPPRLPATLGLEGMGIVHEQGEGVKEEYGLKEGQRVFPCIPRPDLAGRGSWQKFVVAPAQDVFPIPDAGDASRAQSTEGRVHSPVGGCFHTWLHDHLSGSPLRFQDDQSGATERTESRAGSTRCRRSDQLCRRERSPAGEGNHAAT